jgi:large subunit ribosomal protein L14e
MVVFSAPGACGRRLYRRREQMFEIGRVCVKLAGRDAERKCVVIDNMDDGHVMIDGQTRRRKCSTSHLDPTNIIIKIKKNASNSEVCAALKKAGIECKEKAEKKKEKKAKPKKTRKALK